MSKKMAEIRLELNCGGHIVTYITCKNEKGLLKKLRKIHGKDTADFGHFKVDDSSVVYADYVIRSVH